MEIRELRAFVAVTEEGSLSAAARKLHLSQSALSQTILSLERQLGVQLLDRHSTGVTVTEPGSVLLREARSLIAQHDRALAAVTGQEAAGPGLLRVGVPLELPADLLPRALAELAAAFPQTRVDISHASSAAQLASLRAGELDVALVRECPADPDYDAVLAVEEALGVILAAGRASELAGRGDLAAPARRPGMAQLPACGDPGVVRPGHRNHARPRDRSAGPPAVRRPPAHR